MKISFQEKSFLPSLFSKVEGNYNRKEKGYLEEIIEYNKRVQNEFNMKDLNFNQWLNYPRKKHLLLVLAEINWRQKERCLKRN